MSKNVNLVWRQDDNNISRIKKDDVPMSERWRGRELCTEYLENQHPRVRRLSKASKVRKLRRRRLQLTTVGRVERKGRSNGGRLSGAVDWTWARR